MSRTHTAIAATLKVVSIDAAVDNLTLATSRAQKELLNPTTAARWYHRQHELLAALADSTGVPLPTVVGIFAVLSPAVDPNRNLFLALQMIGSDDCSHPHGRQISKARAILNGADISANLGQGLKVRNFYRNLMEPDRRGAVTIDRHAYDVAVGVARGDQERKVLDRRGGYVAIASAYRTVARWIGLAPHELQAMLWCWWRELAPADRLVATP